MRAFRPLALGLAVVLSAAACSGNTAAEPSPVAAASASGAASASAPASAEASGPAASTPASAAPSASGTSYTLTTPVTTLKGALDKPGAGFDPNKLYGNEPGAVTYSWFRTTAGTMVVIFFGGARAPLCVATSIETSAGIEYLTASPYKPGGCDGNDKTLATPPAGAQICNGGFLVYVSAIPNDAVGTLNASFEKTQPDGSVTDLTSATDTNLPQSSSDRQLDMSTLSCVPAA